MERLELLAQVRVPALVAVAAEQVALEQALRLAQEMVAMVALPAVEAVVVAEDLTLQLMAATAAQERAARFG